MTELQIAQQNEEQLEPKTGETTKKKTNVIKFTKGKLDALPAPDPSGKQTPYWDLDLTGFGVLISGVSKTKSYIVQRKLGTSGKTRRVTLAQYNVLTLDEARERAKAVLAEFYAGVDPKAARRSGRKRTLNQVYDAYIDARKDLRDKSKEDYRWVLDHHLKDWLDLTLGEITREMVEAEHKRIKEKIDLGKKQNSKRRIAVTGDATANKAMRCLRALWNFEADEDDTLGANPVRGLSSRRAWYKKQQRNTLVRPDDMPDFYKALDALGTDAGLQIEDRDKPIKNQIASEYLKLILFTGLRRGEAAALEWKDLDFTTRLIHIPGEKTKSGRDLVLPMSDFVFGLLIGIHNRGRDKSGYVFPARGKKGFIQEPKFFLGLIRAATVTDARPEGIHVTPHDLRRTFLTVAESTDLSPMALKALVNHSIKSDVTGGYVQMTAERLRGPAQRITDRLRELCGIVMPEIGGKAAGGKGS